MRNLGFIKSTQMFLWALTLVSCFILAGLNHREVQTFELFNTTLVGLKIDAGIRVDILSSLLFFMITTLGAAIGQYSLRYLDGEDRQEYFYKYLTGIVLSASLLVLSSNLIMFFFMWVATSYNLHKLLVYFSERPQALAAARKKAIVSRIGDIALLGAIVLTYSAFHSFNFTEIFAQTETLAPDSVGRMTLSAIGILTAIGALTKSAQVPFHFWLPETMETPTPVSALMHAGVINAGGILVIRMSPILQHAAGAHLILAVVGTLSAVFGALCMIAQNDIKKKLAYSTISQMGMMMFACGLGAYSIALFHIFAHSFYKAYAFLSTGKLVEESKKLGLHIKTPSTVTMVVAGTLGLSAIAAAASYGQGQYLPAATYGAVIMLGFFQNLTSSRGSVSSVLRTLAPIAGSVLIAMTLYAGIEYSLNRYLEEFVPSTFSSPFDRYTLSTISVGAFTVYLGSFVLASRLMNINTPFLERTYMYLRNGGYLGLKSSVLLAEINALPKTHK